MLCADTNVWIAFLEGEKGADIETLEIALRFEHAMLAPPVVTELLSQPDLPEYNRAYLQLLPHFRLRSGFWERAGALRARMVQVGTRPKLADTLIAQICLDHEVPLLTRDRDFAPFVKHAGLLLAK